MKNSWVQRIASLSAAFLLIAAASAALAQTPSDADKKFVDAALKGNMEEVDLGRMASQKGTSEDVKDFGQRMVTDHTRMGDQMRTLAEQIGVNPPESTSAAGLATKTKLAVLTGHTFDDEYIKAMVADHQQDLKDFQNEAQNGSSPAVRRAARQGATVIQSHLEMIQKIAQAHNVSAENGSKPSGSRGQ